MKKLLFILLLIFPLFLSAQKQNIKDKFQDYTKDNVYSIDGNNIVVSRIIEGVSGSKDDIYIKVKDFFTRNYQDAKSVLQTDDKSAGVLIGKGYYRDVYVLKALGIRNTVLNCYHIFRVDIKDNRVRVICSADTWEEYDGKGQDKREVLIKDYAPITDKRFFDKGKQMEAFVNLIERMQSTIDILEKTVKGGSLSIESENW